MKNAPTLLLLFLVAAGVLVASAAFHSAAMSAAASASASLQSAHPAPAVASVLDRDISAVEKQIVDATDAMPEDRFNFTPESLNIPGSNYKGVRSFAAQIKHIAASNWFLRSPLADDKLPEGLKDDGNASANLQTKADIIKFLKNSFALGHKGAATLTAENMLQSPAKSKATRLHLAEFGVAHAYDHYGEVVEYLRMNGIIPPASRSTSE